MKTTAETQQKTIENAISKGFKGDNYNAAYDYLLKCNDYDVLEAAEVNSLSGKQHASTDGGWECTGEVIDFSKHRPGDVVEVGKYINSDGEIVRVVVTVE